MSRHGVWAVPILCGLIAAPVQAGLYELSQKDPGPGGLGKDIRAIPFGPFRSVLADLSKIGFEQQESPIRSQYLSQREELEHKVRTGRATVNDRIDLGACLVRLRKYEEAVEVLTPAAAEDRSNFLVLANLATANQLAGRLVRAIDYLSQEKDVWPRQSDRWTPQQLDWYRRAETFHLKLLRLRANEERQFAGARKAPEQVDDLFGVRFEGDSGQYEAGTIAAGQKDKLPPDALAVVQQLLVWLPDDTRLYWLMGELLNVRGDVAEAVVVLDGCVNERRYDATALREHRTVLHEALENARTPEAAPSWMPDRKQLLLVGGIAGLVVLVFGYFQVRELRHRWQQRSAAGKGG